MTSFNELLQQGASNAWFFIPSAILLGALHGLEPGHVYAAKVKNYKPHPMNYLALTPSLSLN